MNEKKTTLADIYRAAGALVTDDGMIVADSMEDLKPFQIVLTVVPQTMSMGDGREPVVEFHALMADDHVMRGGMVSWYENDFDFKIPVSQVRIYKETE